MDPQFSASSSTSYRAFSTPLEKSDETPPSKQLHTTDDVQEIAIVPSGSLAENLAVKNGISNLAINLRPTSVSVFFLESLRLQKKQREHLTKICGLVAPTDNTFRALNIELWEKLSLAKEQFNLFRLQRALSQDSKAAGEALFSNITTLFSTTEYIFRTRLIDSQVISSTFSIFETHILQIETMVRNLKAIASNPKQDCVNYAEKAAEYLEDAQQTLKLYYDLYKNPRQIIALAIPIIRLFQLSPFEEKFLQTRSIARIKAYLDGFYEEFLTRKIDKELSTTVLQLREFVNKVVKLYQKSPQNRNTLDAINEIISKSSEALVFVLNNYNVEIIEEMIKKDDTKKALLYLWIYAAIIRGSLLADIRLDESPIVNFFAIQHLETMMHSESLLPHDFFDPSKLLDLTQTIENHKALLIKLGLKPIIDDLITDIDNDVRLNTVYIYLYRVIKQESLITELVKNKDQLIKLKAHQEQQFLKWKQLGRELRNQLTTSLDVLQLTNTAQSQLNECFQKLEITLEQWALNLLAYAYFSKEIFEPMKSTVFIKDFTKALHASTLTDGFIPKDTWTTMMRPAPNKETLKADADTPNFDPPVVEPKSPSAQEELLELMTVTPQDFEKSTDEVEDPEEVTHSYEAKGKQKEKSNIQDIPSSPDDDLEELTDMLRKRGLKWEKLIRILGNLGGQFVRTSGSHHIVDFGKGGPTVPVPKKPQQKRGTQLEIADQVADALRPSQPKATDTSKESGTSNSKAKKSKTKNLQKE